MHPILSRFRQLGLYLLAWVPLAGILMYLLVRAGESWRVAAALTVPLCFVYAFLCLARRGIRAGLRRWSRRGFSSCCLRTLRRRYC
jgi:hypothetical protein